MAQHLPAWQYTGIRVRSLERSIRFYRRLGFRLLRRGRMDHGGRWVDLAFPGTPHHLELNFYPRSNPFYVPYAGGESLDHLGFHVPDVEAWVRRARRLRLPIVADWTERGMRLVYIRDPDGIWLEVEGRVPAARRAPRRRGTQG